jgi:hypothetical protein
MTISHLESLKRQRADLFAELEAAGGRGVELADEIDALDAQIKVTENPPSPAEAHRRVLELAELYIEEVGYPPDTDAAQEAVIDKSIEIVKQAHLRLREQEAKRAR